MAFDLGEEPADMVTAGQLSDDVASVREFLARATDEHTAVWHEAGHLVGIVRRLAAMDLPAATDGAGSV